jgi:membrane-associated phospholipid phosphatase
VHPADEYVQQHMLNNRLADDFFKPGQVIGIVGPWAGSAITYAWGRIADKPKISHVGMDLLRGQVVAYTLTQGLKYATQRERPDGSGATSFPSGHASATFAAATTLERHLGWRYVVPAYVIASYVAVSRLPANRHWLSDVVFGAAVGIISGRTVTSNEAQPYPVSVAPTPGGVVVTWSPARFNR